MSTAILFSLCLIISGELRKVPEGEGCCTNVLHTLITSLEGQDRTAAATPVPTKQGSLVLRLQQQPEERGHAVMAKGW